jgi:hypothetical protein
MGLLTTLRQYNIRFNPKPWANPNDFTEGPVNSVIKVQDISFMRHHLEVTRKVDALIAQMEQEGRFENIDMPSRNETNIAPEKIISDLEQTVLRK